MAQLTTSNHDRDSAGLKYVYPVMSRRAGGLSIGINFNPNNACNWRCIYCQVPGLIRGSAPDMDLDALASELSGFLWDVQHGDFFDRYQIPSEQRIVKDIAISGNGEATSLKNFPGAVQLIGEIANQAGIFPSSKFVLISNGSLLRQTNVQQGLRVLARYNGELWFKLDSATPEGRRLINNCRQSQKALLGNLSLAASLCPTKLQTCVLHYRQAWGDEEKQAYLALLAELKQLRVEIRQVMLYTLARPSLQPEADALTKADAEEMNALAADIRALGYDVGVSV